METFELIKEKGKCCISGLPLKSSAHVNMIELEFKAQWKYPVAGNIVYGISGMAVAIVHDACILAGKIIGDIKYAVEIKEGEIIYHAVPDIQRCRVCGCHELDACFHPMYGNCFWVENDLCSHCKKIPKKAKRFSLIMRELEEGYYNPGEGYVLKNEVIKFYKASDLLQ